MLNFKVNIAVVDTAAWTAKLSCLSILSSMRHVVSVQLFSSAATPSEAKHI